MFLYPVLFWLFGWVYILFEILICLSKKFMWSIYTMDNSIAIRKTNVFLQKVYSWMLFALLISALSAYGMSQVLLLHPEFSSAVMLMIIVELILVMILSFGINKINSIVAICCFILYSLLTWATLSIVLQMYVQSSVTLTFLISAGVFGFMSVYGYFTHSDLTGIGKIAIMWLFGIILASVVNFFVQSSGMDYIISWVWVLVFTWLTAYDTQKLKEMSLSTPDGWMGSKLAIIWALRLYLDFINLFLDLLRLFGKRK